MENTKKNVWLTYVRGLILFKKEKVMYGWGFNLIKVLKEGTV